MSCQHAVVLTPAGRTTPTLWSHMRLCSLRAALSVSREADEWVLHSPRTWLGTAFHRLMADGPRDAREAAALWDAAIAGLRDVALRHRLDLRFASPESWPGYYLVRQRAIASAVEHGSSSAAAAYRRRPPSDATPGHGSKNLLTARGGRLAGRPDHYDQFTVTEYKSALPDPAWAESASIIDGYWRQLRLYSVLIGESGVDFSGSCPILHKLMSNRITRRFRQPLFLCQVCSEFVVCSIVIEIAGFTLRRENQSMVGHCHQSSPKGRLRILENLPLTTQRTLLGLRKGVSENRCRRRISSVDLDTNY